MLESVSRCFPPKTCLYNSSFLPGNLLRLFVLFLAVKNKYGIFYASRCVGRLLLVIFSLLSLAFSGASTLLFYLLLSY